MIEEKNHEYVCLGYYDQGKLHGMTESERNAMFDACFEYDGHLRANGHSARGEALQPPEAALTLSWKNGKVATTDGNTGGSGPISPYRSMKIRQPTPSW
jgi:hypothetical protein